MAAVNVLLIEDDLGDAQTVRRLLENCYFNNANGAPRPPRLIHRQYFQKALEVLEEDQDVNIVILDLNLPDGKGIGLVKHLSREHPHVPIVVLTGEGSDHRLGLTVLREGAEDYVCKDSVSQSALNRILHYAMERHNLVRKIKQQAQELKESHEELEAFTHIASHDLRSPLINIRGFSAELKHSVESLLPVMEQMLPMLEESHREQAIAVRRELDTRMPQALGYIYDSVKKMDRLISAILEYTRLGRRNLEYEQIDIRQLVEQCIQTFEHQIQTSGITVRIGHMPSAITADRISMEQVFCNLLDNALKYLDPARPGDIRISGSQNHADTVFSVVDNGRGIAEDDKHKVFEIFRRGGCIDDIPGEGVGMPYVKAILKRHNGKIWFESEPGKGTCFYFSIAKDLTTDKEDNLYG